MESQSNQIAQEQSSLAQERPSSKDSLPHQSCTQCNSLNHKGQKDTTDQSALRSEPLDGQCLHTLNVASIATVKSGGQQTDQPAFKKLTWLSNTLQALQFPLSLDFTEETKLSEPGAPSRVESLEGQGLLESSRQSTEVVQKKRKPPAKKLRVKAAKEKMQSSEGVTGAISPCVNAQKSKNSQLKQCDTKDKPVTLKRKRKCDAHTEDASDRTYTVTRYGAGEFSQIFLNMCSVRLSCNNVLSKKNTLKQEPPLSKEPQEVLDTTAVNKGCKKSKADQTITKTRKRSTPRARSASKIKDKRDEIVKNVPVIKRKRGRPQKIQTVPHDTNPATDEISESDRKTNVKAKIGEKCGPYKEKLRGKRRKVVQNVPVSNDAVHDDVSSDTIFPSCAVSLLRVDEEQLCAQQRDPETIEPNVHRCSENTHTPEGKRVNPAIKSNKGEEETSEMEREEMVEVVLDGGPGSMEMVVPPDQGKILDISGRFVDFYSS